MPVSRQLSAVCWVKNDANIMTRGDHDLVVPILTLDPGDLAEQPLVLGS